MKKGWIIPIVIVGLVTAIVIFSEGTYYSDDFQRYVEVYHNSDFGTDDPQYLLPSMTFIKDYEYLDGGYHWKSYEESSGFNSLERVILNLTYDTNVYGEAKKLAFDNCYFESTTYTYNNYIFRENLAWQFSMNEAGHSDIEKRRFPYQFIMFGTTTKKMCLFSRDFVVEKTTMKKRMLLKRIGEHF